MSITTALTRHARETPNSVALVYENRSLSYAELDTIVTRLAAFILNKMDPTDQIALDLPNSPALVLLLLATSRAGHEARVLDPSWQFHSEPLSWTTYRLPIW